MGDRDEYTPAPVGTLLKQSASGGCNAQGALAAELFEMGNRGFVRPLEAWAGVELLARMAAAHGDPADARGLALVLIGRAEWERANDFPEVANNLAAEAIQLLDRLADNGDEEAAAQLIVASRFCSTDVLDLARGPSLADEEA